MTSETFFLRNNGSRGRGGLCGLKASFVRYIPREKDRLGAYLALFGIGSIEGGTFALLGRFPLGGCGDRFFPDNRFCEICVLSPTDPTFVTQNAAGKTFRGLPPLNRLPRFTRRAHHIASWLLHDRSFVVVICRGRGRSFGLLVGSTLFPDLGVDFLEFRARG